MPDGATDNAQPQSFARSSLAFALLTTRLPTSTPSERRSPAALTNGTTAPKLAASGDLRADQPTDAIDAQTRAVRFPLYSTAGADRGAAPDWFQHSCPLTTARRCSTTPSELGISPPASTLLPNLDVVCASGPSTYHQSA